jgi:hypothetical protein
MRGIHIFIWILREEGGYRDKGEGKGERTGERERETEREGERVRSDK